MLTNSRAVNTNLGNLGLDLHSSSLELLISLGHSPRSGGTSSHLGGTARECPPVAPGLAQSNSIVLWDFTNNFVCVIFIVVSVLIRITNKNQRRSIKVLKMKKKKRMLHCVHLVSIPGRVKSNAIKMIFAAFLLDVLQCIKQQRNYGLTICGVQLCLMLCTYIKRISAILIFIAISFL